MTADITLLNIYVPDGLQNGRYRYCYGLGRGNRPYRHDN